MEYAIPSTYLGRRDLLLPTVFDLDLFDALKKLAIQNDKKSNVDTVWRVLVFPLNLIGRIN